VISRHNEIRDELSDLSSKAFIPSAVRDEPKIYFSRPVEKKKQEVCEPFEILPHTNDIQCETARVVMPPLDYYESWM
jgi:hypothetical protein